MLLGLRDKCWLDFYQLLGHIFRLKIKNQRYKETKKLLKKGNGMLNIRQQETK